ncbi:hypothetical protein GCM10020221_10960 [Streptomyces thioluteus]|uniref:Uncharacterized protein n=1 Tax=Streptomyces thioluteus TaxID=66431 RepID=A0ABN3WIM6_STRTU
MFDDVAGGHVAGEDAQGVGPAALAVGLRAVDHVAPEDGEFGAVDDLGGPGAGLGELPRDAACPQDGLAGGQAERPGEQVEQCGLARDVVTRALLRVLGAVPGLQHQGLTERYLAQEGT